MKRIFFALLIVIVLQSFSLGKTIIATYEGKMPGADCAALKITLTLYKGCCDAMGTYDEKDTYIATKDGDKTFHSSGKWQYTKGRKQGKDDVILQLNYNKPDKIENYLVIGDSGIKPLDKEMNDIKCPFDQTLKKLPKK